MGEKGDGSVVSALKKLWWLILVAVLGLLGLLGKFGGLELLWRGQRR